MKEPTKSTNEMAELKTQLDLLTEQMKKCLEECKEIDKSLPTEKEKD